MFVYGRGFAGSPGFVPGGGAQQLIQFMSFISFIFLSPDLSRGFGVRAILCQIMAISTIEINLNILYNIFEEKSRGKRKFPPFPTRPADGESCAGMAILKQSWCHSMNYERNGEQYV